MQGLGNKFLANIREADAICQVVRAFADPDVTHVDGKVDPSEDIATVNTELVLADLQTVDARLATARARGADEARRSARSSRPCRPRVPCSTRAGRSPAIPALDREALRESFLLTDKPFIYVFNLDDTDLGDDGLSRPSWRDLVAPAPAVFVSAKLESELIGLDAADAAELLEEYGQHESGLAILARVGLRDPRAADLPHGRAQGVAGLDDQARRDRTRGRRRDPHRLPEGLHQGRDRLVRRPGRGRLDRRRLARPARRGSRARTT